MASLSTVRSTAGTLDVGVGGAAEGASPFATLSQNSESSEWTLS